MNFPETLWTDRPGGSAGSAAEISRWREPPDSGETAGRHRAMKRTMLAGTAPAGAAHVLQQTGGSRHRLISNVPPGRVPAKHELSGRACF